MADTRLDPDGHARLAKLPGQQPLGRPAAGLLPDAMPLGLLIHGELEMQRLAASRLTFCRQHSHQRITRLDAQRRAGREDLVLALHRRIVIASTTQEMGKPRVVTDAAEAVIVCLRTNATGRFG